MADISKVKLKASGTEYNIKDASAFRTGDTADTTIDNADTIPFYDTSATAKKKITVQNLRVAIVGKLSQTISVSSSSVTLDRTHLTAQITVTGAETTIRALSNDPTVATPSVSGDTITISNVNLKNGNANITVYAEETSEYSVSNSITVNVSADFTPEIYGVTWDGTSTTAWSRTDDAALFTDPVPQLSNGSGGWTTGSSPFDNIAPWSGMTTSERTGGIMVAIPKFYYKLTKTGSAMSLKITAGENATWALGNGYQISPAHMDRGDGSGERNIVYVGRYQCANYRSQTNMNPTINTTRSTFRTSISGVGTGIYQWDYATLLTIWMLYLVEFADWNTQAKIGKGCSSGSSLQKNGATDSMTYHTGTNVSSRDSGGFVQYRNIENLWANAFECVDGIYYNGGDIYAIKNPNNFSDSQGGTKVGTRPTASGNIKAMFISSVTGFTWFMHPSATEGTDNTIYVSDNFDYDANGVFPSRGGFYSIQNKEGLFYLNGAIPVNGSYPNMTSRIMELP